jgi:ACS family tartrate transporter-like MFS transporter
MITLAMTGLYAFKSPFWAVPNSFLTRSTAAISIAVINSIGNLGGFVGPYAIDLVKESTGSALGGLYFLAALLFVSFAMMMAMRLQPEREEAAPSALAASAGQSR